MSLLSADEIRPPNAKGVGEPAGLIFDCLGSVGGQDSVRGLCAVPEQGDETALKRGWGVSLQNCPGAKACLISGQQQGQGPAGQDREVSVANKTCQVQTAKAPWGVRRGLLNLTPLPPPKGSAWLSPRRKVCLLHKFGNRPMPCKHPATAKGHTNL